MPVGDLFRVQDELTRRIVASLSLPLTNREQQMLQRDVPSNAAAYEYFLRGNQLSHDAKQWSVARDLYLQMRRGGSALRAGVGAPRPDPSRDGEVPADGDAGEPRSARRRRSGGRSSSTRICRSRTSCSRSSKSIWAVPHDAMARLIERAHTRRPGAAGRPREHLPLLRPARRIGRGARARARARAEDPHERRRTRGSCRGTTRASRRIKIADYPYIVALVAGRARTRPRGAARAARARTEDCRHGCAISSSRPARCSRATRRRASRRSAASSPRTSGIPRGCSTCRATSPS